MKAKKKLDGGLSKILIFILFYFSFSTNTYCNQILDYETEEFINQIIEDIIKVNGIIPK